MSSQTYINTVSTDRNADGVIDDIVTTVYDDNGNVIRIILDSDGDRTPNSITTYTYDTENNLIQRSEDFDGNGSIDRLFNNYTYDAAGNRTSEPYGGNSDGTIFRTYDAAGNLTSSSIDFQNDGILDSIYRQAYDADGNLTGTFSDDNGDGIVDRSTVYTYDAAGNRISQASDINGDGIIDLASTTQRTFDAAGNLTSISSDNNGDGIPDSLDVYTYDAAGNLTSVSIDFEGDGVFDSINTYSYDAAGNRIFEAVDYDGDGTPNLVTTAAYNAAGQLIRASNDSSGDGIFESNDVYTYNAAGYLTNVSSYGASEIASQTNPNRVVAYTYDEAGNVTSETQDTNGDGVPESVVTYAYTKGPLDEENETVVYQPLLQQFLIAPDGNDRFSKIDTYEYNLDGQVSIKYINYIDSFSTQSTYVYDEAGNLLQENSGDGPSRAYTYDAANNVTSVASVGSSEPFETYTYNIQGNLESVTSFGTRPDGSFGQLTEWLIYDEMENLTSRVLSVENGPPSVLETYEYNAAGLETSAAKDVDRDGVLDYFTSSTYTYNYDGSLTKTIAIDSYGDGVVDSIYAYTFNTLGQKVEAARDINADGTPDIVVVYTYDERGNQLTESIKSDVITIIDAQGNRQEVIDLNIDRSFEQVSSQRYIYDAAGNKIKESKVGISLNPDLRDRETRFPTYEVDQIFGAIAIGTAGDDVITGTQNNDLLKGEAGNDTLVGSFGNDVLVGGLGNDQLTGGPGPGQDIFVLALAEGTDTITDFAVAEEDLIGLAGGIGFGDLTFIGSDIVVGSTGEVLATLTGVDTTLLQADRFVLF